MNNIHRYTASITLLLLTTYAHATPIQLDIVGEGAVSVKETDTQCEQSCEINNDLSKNTLIPQATGDWKFSHWEGATCDAGNGMIMSDDMTMINASVDGAKTLVSGDFDSDGDMDLVAIGLFSKDVSLLTNDGVGNFNDTPVLTQMGYPSALAAYDWDTDGDTDVLVSDFDTGLIHLLLNDGHGTFIESDTIRLTGISPYALTVQDENEDGFPDILVSHFRADTTGDLSQLVNTIRNAGTTWYHNNGEDDFISGSLLSENAAITLDSSINPQSGKIAVVAAEIGGEGIVLYENQQRVVIQESESAYGVALGDMDNNGTLDVLAALYRPSQLMMLMGDSQGGFGQAKSLGSPAEGVTATVIADLNGDGLKELASGQFNLDSFYFHQAKSYLECVIENNHQLSVTAVFVSDSSTPAPAPAPPPANPVSDNTPAASNNASGGGMNPLLMAVVLIMTLCRRKLK